MNPALVESIQGKTEDTSTSAEAGASAEAAPAPEIPDDLADVAATVTETVAGLWQDLVVRTPFLVAGILVLLVTWGTVAIFRRVAPKILGGQRLRRSLRDLIERLITMSIWAVGLTVAMVIVFPGLTPAKALGALGLVSIAVGFAFKDIFENFFAGVLLLWRFPFETGDFVECQGITGRVEEITIRMTLIRLTSGELVVVPNSFLFKNPVNILTNQPTRRVTIMAGVAYGEDVAASVDVIEKAVSSCDTVDRDNPIQVFPQAFGASSIDIEVAWWTEPTPLDVRRSRGEVVTAIKSALDDAGIEIPFPYRTLTFKEPLPLRREGGEEDRCAGNGAAETGTEAGKRD